MYIFQSEEVIKLRFISDLQITSLILKSPFLNGCDTLYSVGLHAKTDQHCRAEDCLAIDMEWFATGVHSAILSF